MKSTFSLTEQHVTLCQQYVELLHSIEEALLYIDESFTNLKKTEAERLKADIFKAFVQIGETNGVLRQIFSDKDEAVVQAVQAFDTVLKETILFNELVGDSRFKQDYFQQKLVPTFQQWSNQIKESFQPYIQH
ncbi:MAG: hypothetical protein H0Z31_01610 [Bacillus sp. (in: Bacteria)]|nr:hypothetical protein [Bacillus sp. (in: firmicutes)]